MEKRLVAAVALSVLILLGWSLIARKFFPPPAAPPVATGAPAVDAAAPTSRTPSVAGSQAPSTPALPGVAQVPAAGAVKEQEVRLDTQLAEIVLTNKGGRVRSWRLKRFVSAGRAADFVSDQARQDDLLPLALVFDDPAILPGINSQLFEISRTEDASHGTHVTFHWSDGAGSAVEKSFVFRPDVPLVDIEVKAVDRGRPTIPRLCWGPGLELESPDHRSNTYYNGQAVAYDGVSVTRFAKRKIDAPIAIPESPHVKWAGLEDQYFTALLLPANSRSAVLIGPASQIAHAAGEKPVPADLAGAPLIAVSIPEGKAQLFAGPKDFGLLSSLGYDLEKAVWFSSFRAIYVCAKPIFLSLRFVHDHWVANYGVAIIILTVGLRLLLFPLNQFSMVKMRKTAGEMQRIQPKLKAIQAKYKKSKDPEARAKMNSETMDLYKREGVNPFGGVSGCLPLLIQMPILWAFYDVLTATVELRGAPFFGWIQDLTHPDAFWITPLLMGGSMFVQQKMTPTANVDPQQQRMMLFMPVIFTVMFGSLPSGLVLYYFVNNLLGIGQQWLVNRHIARLEAAPSKA